jgi:peptidoglycan LD-endopeptidase LytH
MGRLGRIVLCVLALMAAGWIGLLVVLPKVPSRSAEAISSVPATAVAERGRQAQGVLRVPVDGIARRDLRDTWDDPRDNGQRAHHGTDIAAPANTPVRAAAPGTVEKLFFSAAGGTTLYVRSPDKAWTYYYAHLASYAPGLREGQVVQAGALLGYVGDTGNAGAGNFHLHFGLARTTPDQHWYEGVDIDPYPYLAGRRLPG